ncbi:MAG: cytochrome c4 [Verrucomicrobia bacterium]|nr:cytochrome c4 [Verrucomicrobiota bacterium]
MAREHGPFATFSPWVLGGICLIVAFWIVSLLIGFIWYPTIGGGGKPSGFLQLICGGLGIVDNRAYAAQPTPSPVVSSELAWTDATWRKIRSGDPRRGTAIAVSCAACHGLQGIRTADYIPNLAGLPPEVIYKQLVDYQRGKRNWVIMNAVATGLSDQDMADVAAYYSNCPRDDLLNSQRNASSDEQINRLVTDGDPLRNVVACAACHGPEGQKTGAPPLFGQPSEYLTVQLVAFSQGTRTNDINRQMRLIASRLTPPEVARLTEYFGSKESKTAGR